MHTQTRRAPTPEAVREALKDVLDPEMPISLVDMGMIYGVAVENEQVHIELGLTATAGPAVEFITSDIRERLAREGWGEVAIELVWDPPWDPKTMASEEVKMMLGIW
jgi:metal-sulfur cluster biosynthetic enzyme